MTTKKTGKKAESEALSARGAAEKSSRSGASAVAAQEKPVAAPQAQDPTARDCPLVLDGEMDAANFTPNACLSCDEFDCCFCEAAQGSGGLRSRLFVGEDDDDDSDDVGTDGWGDDADVSIGEEDEADEEDDGASF